MGEAHFVRQVCVSDDVSGAKYKMNRQTLLAAILNSSNCIMVNDKKCVNVLDIATKMAPL